MWRTTVWLEAGTYRVQGRVKVEGVVPPVAAREESSPNPNEAVRPGGAPGRVAGLDPGGAGFRVSSSRKVTDGSHWGWLPFRESRDLAHRGDLPPLAGSGGRVSGSGEWTPITYEFELRQPIADLSIACELNAVSGRAVFEAALLSIARIR